MKEQSDLLQKKGTLQLFVSISTSIKKIEKLLQIESEATTVKYNSTGTIKIDKNSVTKVLTQYNEETSNLIERVASEFNQLKYNVSKGKHLLFVKNMESKIQYIENNLQMGLEGLFKEGIYTKNKNIISNCLRTYSAIDKIEEPQILYRKWIVKGWCSTNITMTLLESNVPGSCDGLSSIFNSLLSFINNECTLLLQITHKSIRGFHFLTNSIWTEFTETLSTKLSKIFTPAFPDLFHKNYTTTLKFIDQFESLFTTYNELHYFRNHSSYKDFLKKWNLDIYFPLRFQDIASKLDNSFYITPQ